MFRLRIALIAGAALAAPFSLVNAQGASASAPGHQRRAEPVHVAPPQVREARARCNDNTVWSAPTRQGACASHNGVKEWLTQNPDHDWPEAAVARCKDGFLFNGPGRAGACTSHGGVKQWRNADEQDNARPRDAAAHCQDGTWWTSTVRSGACASHGGVKHWLGNGRAARPKNS
jgi:hypothetical protein